MKGKLQLLDFNDRTRTGISKLICPTLVAQGVSARFTGHILEVLFPQGELKE